MTETITLAPHDPMPSGPGRHVIVLRRFREDDPAQTETQIILTGIPEQSTHPRQPDGTLMDLDQAVAAGVKVAESEGLSRIFVLDRTSGRREQDILQHGGDHTVHMEELADSNVEEGERGPDMRDMVHPKASGTSA